MKRTGRGSLQPSHTKMITGLLFLLLSTVRTVHAADPWTELRDFYGAPKTPAVVFEEDVPVKEPSLDDQEKNDPWAILQGCYIPFTEKDEAAARVDPQARRKVSAHLHERLAPFRSLIAQASSRFNIPPEVLGAIIMVESSGNPRAKAKTSSAKGLMQTIDSTFAEARQGLDRIGLPIHDNPYNPQASILAGSWYLDRMFHQMEQDWGRSFDRNSLAVWQKVAEYYYAGPNHARKREGVVIMYAGGKRVEVDKAGYAQKVMQWALAMG